MNIVHASLRLILEMPLISPASFGLITFLLALVGLFVIGVDQQIESSVIVQLVASACGFFIACTFNKIPSKIYMASGGHTNNFSPLTAASMRRQYKLMYSTMTVLFLLNFLVNTNFQTLSPDARFAAVKLPILQTICNAIFPVQALLLVILPIKNFLFPVASIPWLIFSIQVASSLFVASSKSVVISYFLMIYFCASIYLIPSLNLTLLGLYRKILHLRISKTLIYYTLPFLTIALSISLALLLSRGIDFDLITERFSNGFDQVFLLSTAVKKGIISREFPVTEFGQPTFLLVWFKSFIRPFAPNLYDLDFDNYSEYLQYLIFGTLTKGYGDTGWAPNNSLFTDIFLAFPSSYKMQFVSCFLITMAIFTIILRSVRKFITTSFCGTFSSAISLVFAAPFFIFPLAFIVDTQYFFTSSVIVLVFVCFVYILDQVMKGAPQGRHT